MNNWNLNCLIHYITASVHMASGTAPRKNVLALAPSMAADITKHLISKDLVLVVTAVTLLSRYLILAIVCQICIINLNNLLIAWYILILVSLDLKNKCGNKTGTFHVITENVPCGTTGTTCSKAVRILLGVRTFIKFYMDPRHIQYTAEFCVF